MAMFSVRTSASAHRYQSKALTAEVFRTEINPANDGVELFEDFISFLDHRPPIDAGVPVFSVREQKRLQVMDGFGAALTESCAINLRKLPDELRDEAMTALFSKAEGAGFDYIRLPVGASDFSDDSLAHYTYDDSPNNIADPEFRYFSLERDRKSLDLILEALEINPDLHVLMSPWSPPAWMKYPKVLEGGTLSSEHYLNFARYLVKVLQAYRDYGIPVDALTIQNEPDYETDGYPSMYLSTEQQTEIIRDYLVPELQRQNVKVKILLLDHNYDQAPDVAKMLSEPHLKEGIGGVAYHCYEGDLSEIEETVLNNPDVPFSTTECTPVLGGNASDNFAGWLNNYIMKPTRLGSTGSMAWNLCLDQKGGPHNGGCDTCKGLLTTDFSQKIPRLIKNPEYYAFAQMSRFIRRGSQRIHVQAKNAQGLLALAFQTGSKTTFVASNPNPYPMHFQIRASATEFINYLLEANSAATFVW